MVDREELVEAVKFPFTSRAKEIVEEIRFDMEKPNDSVIETARKRVLSAIEPEPLRLGRARSVDILKDELLSYPIAKILVSLVRDASLGRRFAQAEADRLKQNLQEKNDPEFYRKIAEELGITITDNKIHFTDYLRALPGRKLVNTDLTDGFISLDESLLVDVIVNTFKNKILSEISKPMKVPKVYQNAVKEIKEEVKITSYKQDFGALNVAAFPPCIKALIQDARAGKKMPHQDRFVLSTFLVNVNMPVEQIVKLFSNTPNFSEKKTRYYVEYSAGKRGSGIKYTPPSCKKMRYYGLCRNKDSLCGKINHPLSYYARKKGVSG